MRYRTNWVDLTYFAAFQVPLFVVSGAPLVFAEALCARLRPQAIIAARDITVSNISGLETRIKVNLFNGNASLEFGPDSLLANFRNPRWPHEIDLIKKLVMALQGFVDEQARTPVPKEETVTVRAFLGLVDAPNARDFLTSICDQSEIYGPSKVAAGSVLSPAMRFDLENASEKWIFNFELSRAVRDPREVFISTSTQFRVDGTPADAEAKAELVDRLITESMSRAGLEPEHVDASGVGPSDA
jgi:hypothetical protein